MLKIALLALVLTSILGAQIWKQYLLPSPIDFKGTVVDQDAQPVPDVHIDHGGDMRIARQTDALGKFGFQTTAPAVVFRKEGYQSVFVRTDSGDLHIILNATPVLEFPGCLAGASVDSIDGWGASFAFPRTKGVTPSAHAQDIDYGARSYSVGTGKGIHSIMHGSGPMWSFGLPSDSDVWRSVQYEETTYKKGVFIITAARGKFSDGKRWRYLGMFGETADYSGVESATADILDKFLDGACWKTQSAK